MRFGKALAAALAAGTVLAATASPAFAHHVMGGKLPGTFVEGLLSGLGHPVIEVSHLAAILLVGAIAARLGSLGLVAAFVTGSFLGTAFLGLAFPLPLGETLIVGSVAVLLMLLVFSGRVHGLWAAVALGAIGVAHGMAFAESIIGAETSPLAAYLLGLALMELALSGVVFAVTFRVARRLRA